jgi:peptide deformylase
MAVRPLRILGRPGDEVLRQQAQPVERIDGDLQALIDDMIDTMRANDGVGLAAPQIGVPLRVVVIEVPGIPVFALINAEIAHHSGQREIEEGCLSIPGYRGDVVRSVKVVAKGLDRQGRRVRIRAGDDLLAQALEHEVDHTNGLLFVDLLPDGGHLHRVPLRVGREPAVIPALPHDGPGWEPPEWRAAYEAARDEEDGQIDWEVAPPRYRQGMPPRLSILQYRLRTRPRLRAVRQPLRRVAPNRRS